MVRQARSEATRRKIMTSAVELFNEIGYPATGLGDIIERAEMTKGALYYHFDSKESLATAIIEEGSVRLTEAFRGIAASSAPALETIIHGVFVVADLMSTDQIARSGMQLLRAFGEFNDAAARTYGGWVTEMTVRDAQGAVTPVVVSTAPAHNYVLGIDFQGSDIWVATAKGLSHGIHQP